MIRKTAAALPLSLALSLALALAACQEPPAETETAGSSAPETSAGDIVSDTRLTAAAFRAAWDAEPPVNRTPAGDDQARPFTYSEGSLVALAESRYAFISSGHGGEGHVDSGALSIHYLERDGDGFRRIGAWPEIADGGTFGNPPSWSVRTDLTPNPALETEGGGTWQGYSCQWSGLIELTPGRPLVRADGLRTAYSAPDESAAYEAELVPGEPGRSFALRYSDGGQPLTYTRTTSGDHYEPASEPDRPWC